MPATTFATAASIGYGDPEQKMQELLHLFLKHHFDGAAHAIETTDPEAGTKTFPACTLLHGAETLVGKTKREEKSLADRPWIRTLVTDMKLLRTHRPNLTDRIIERDVTWQHIVQVVNAGQSDHRPAMVAREIANLLHLIYTSSPALTLARKGLTRVRLESGPVEVPMAGYQLRQLQFTGRLRLTQVLPAA